MVNIIREAFMIRKYLDCRERYLSFADRYRIAAMKTNNETIQDLFLSISLLCHQMADENQMKAEGVQFYGYKTPSMRK